ncbi:xanthotoxin 5-hydroxylase CYP82C4-like isoform X2 [Tasmannia lanceolata]|uniref:xanthotoxin 5-hydroxylase CYP82C4-like isoform X2 n=1 Tax=Tasmannia lanceolata TaxID=3420 RepID=UPI004064AD03
MDLLISLQALTGFLVLIIFYNICFRRAKSSKSKTKNPPEPAGGWPVIGHLHLLPGSKPLFRTFAALADIYGPVFRLRLGWYPTLIVSSPELAKECFTTNDKALATRPKSAAGKYMGYNHAMFGTAPYGPYWRQMRKIATVELLSNRRLELLKKVYVTEIDSIIKELYRLWAKNDQNPVKVDMKRWFNDLMFNVVVMMIAGKRYFQYSFECKEGEERRFQQAINRLMHLAVRFVVSDALPFLEWMDLDGHLSDMKKTAKEFDSVLVSWLEEHRRDKRSGEVDGEKDFLDVMLSIQESAQIPGYDHDTVIKATSMTLIIGGTETTSIVLTWALCMLLNNPQVLKKVQTELDIHVGKERQVDESDVKKLVYLQAIVKETLRLYPAAPLGVPHEAIEDCHIGGFHVPAGTRVFVNIWKLHRDPHVWSDPLDFRPERFLTGRNVDFKDQDFGYMPFGSGRRSCPGMSLALPVLHLMLARLLQSFDMAAPTDTPLDMTESIGITAPKSSPLEVLFTPRLPSELY